MNEELLRESSMVLSRLLILSRLRIHVRDRHVHVGREPIEMKTALEDLNDKRHDAALELEDIRLLVERLDEEPPETVALATDSVTVEKVKEPDGDTAE